MSNIKAKNSNVLLISHPVGHPRPSSYDLPPPNHTYGITIKKDPFNTAATGICSADTFLLYFIF